MKLERIAAIAWPAGSLDNPCPCRGGGNAALCSPCRAAGL